jgi:UDP-sulfoquinovose synthase
MGLNVQINSIPNPRVESENHYYNVVHSKLLDLGLQPHLLDDDEIEHMISIAVENRDRIDQRMFLPTVNWREAENDVKRVEEQFAN